MHDLPLRSLGLLMLLGMLSLVGCKKTPVPEVKKPETVVTEKPIVRETIEYEEFTGRTEARDTVDLRARVTGYLDKAEFEEGALVEKDAPLFEVDSRTYQAELDRARAMVRQFEATQNRLALDLQRARTLRNTSSISVEELDRIIGNRAEAEASVSAAKASVRTAELNLGFTKITAPIKGRIGRRLVDPKNLIKADETILTTIVSLDPIHAYFDIDERTVIKLRKDKLPFLQKEDAKIPLFGLAGEAKFTLVGAIDFADNRLDPGTGTLRVRGSIRNENEQLSPGMFLRLRLPVSRLQKYPMIAETAIMSDQGQKYVYVVQEKVGEDKTVKQVVAYRPVFIGQLIEEPSATSGGIGKKLRVIKSGLSATDRVIVDGQQKVKVGAEVAEKEPAKSN